jgi:hypothetical protein
MPVKQTLKKPRRGSDIRKRFGELLGALVGDALVATVDQIVDWMELRTKVRPSTRRRYVAQYLAGLWRPDPIWAYEIGEAIPRPWCTGLWALWCAGCFEEFILTLQLAFEQTNDQYLDERALQIWHFIDALQYVAAVLPFDHFREVRAINLDRDMPISSDALRFRDLFEVLRRGGCPYDRINRELYFIFRRQVAKRRLAETSIQLSAMVELSWPLVGNPKYAKYYAGIRGEHGFTITIPAEVSSQIRIPPPEEPEQYLDKFVNEHLESAFAIANDHGGVKSRATRIVDDLKRWAASYSHSRQRNPVEGDALDEAFGDLFDL